MLVACFQFVKIVTHSDDLSASGGTRKDLLSFDTKYTLSYSQFGPVSDHMTIT